MISKQSKNWYGNDIDERRLEWFHLLLIVAKIHLISSKTSLPDIQTKILFKCKSLILLLWFLLNDFFFCFACLKRFEHSTTRVCSFWRNQITGASLLFISLLFYVVDGITRLIKLRLFFGSTKTCLSI